MKWLRWLRPGVDDPAPDAAPEPDPAPETIEAEPAPETTAPDPAEQHLEESAQELLRRLDHRTAEIERRQTTTPAPEPVRPAASDPEYAQEEAQLERARTSGMSESDQAWMQWQINTNRQNRETRRIAERAAREAQENADRADFSRLEFTAPDLYRSYGPRIEKIIAEQRAKGLPVAPRGAILRLLIGDDHMNRKQAPKAARPAAAAKTPERTPLPRARSDVQARASQSDRDARRRRLEGKPI